ncbi:hypothetical protein TVAG_532580, partial [Trichomonas vaginalis G3]
GHLSHVAAKCGSTSFVEELLQHENVDVNRQNLMKRTPIFNAIENEKIEVVKVLLSREDLDLSVVDSEGHTAKDVALQTKNEDIINLLLNK